jgi:pSer/pThr/pTyr-binding forkhead associated (FHA) protein
LKDLESLNGTKVNDVRIDKGGLVELSNGDTVEFGKSK